MPCLLLVLALLLPRVALVLIFLFTDWLAAAFDVWLWPLLGFIFLPYTILAWIATALNTGGDITLGWLILLVLAVIVDISHWGGGYRSRSRKTVVVKR